LDRINILLVDDEEMLLEASKLYLEKLSKKFKVQTIKSAKDALDILSKKTYDVIISDYQMPEINGLQFLSTLRENGNNSPFIIFTGKGREEVAIQALNLGADFYLQKGGETQSQFRELVNLIDKLVEKKHTDLARLRLLEQQLSINRLALTLGETRDLNRIYKTIFQHIYSLMDADTFVVDFYDKDSNTISPGYTLIEENVIDITMFPPIPLGHRESEIQSRVIQSGELLYIPDLYKRLNQNEMTEIDSELLNSQGFTKSAIYVPMKIGGEIIGVLQVQSYKYDAYSQEDIELLSALTNFAAVAIQNARLFSNQYQMTQNIIEEKNRAQLYLDVVDAMVIFIDREGIVRMINKRGYELLGYREEEIIGHNWFEGFHPESTLEEVKILFQEIIDKKRDNFTPEPKEVLTKSGDILKVQWTNIVLYDNQSEVTGILSSGMDITGETQVQKELRTIETKFERLIESINDGIAIFEKNKTVFINDKAIEIYGYPREELMNLNHFDICAPEEKERLREIFATDNETKGPIKEISFWIVTNKGEKRFVHHRYSYTYDEEGIVNTFVIITDKTNELLAEEAIKSSEENYKTILNLLGVPIHVVDKELKIILANQTLLDWISNFGIDTDIIGKTVFEVFPFLPESVKDEYDQTILSKKPVITFESERDNQLGVLTETRKIPVIEKGEVVRIITVIRDVTAYKETELKLKESEEKQRLLYDNLSDCIIVYNLDWKIVDCNKKAIEILGFTSEELLDMKLTDLVKEDQKDLFLEQNQRVIESGYYDYNLMLIKKERDILPSEISASIIELEGEVLIQAIIRDLSEKLKIDEERIQHIKELMFLSRTAFDFVSFSPNQDIFNYIAEKVKELTKESIVVVVSYDSINSEFTIQAIQGLKIPRLGGILGYNPIGRIFKVNDSIINFMNQKGIGEIDISIPELVDNIITNKQDSFLNKKYNISSKFLMPFIYQDNLLGAVLILLQNNNQLGNIELLETFASQTAAALLKRKADYELQDSEERYKKLFNDSSDGIILYDSKFNIIDVNLQATEITGFSKAIIKEKKFTDLIPKQEMKYFLERNKNIKREGVVKLDLLLKHKTERLVTVEIVANLIELDQREIVQIIFRDVTQKKIAEEIRTKHLDTLRFVSSTAMDLVGLPPEKNLYEFISDKVANLAGDSIIVVSTYEEAFAKFQAKAITGISDHMIDIGKILGKNPYEMLVTISDEYLDLQYFGKIVKLNCNLEELTDGMISKIQSNLLWKLLGLGEMYSITFSKEGKLFGSVLIIMKKDRQIQNVELVEAFGSQASVALIRKRAEEELGISEERFRNLIETMNDGFGVDDKNGNIIYANAKLCEMMGYKLEEIIGRHATEFMDEKNKQLYLSQNEARSKGEQESYEIYWKRKSGENIPTIVSPRAFIDASGNYQGSFAVVTDITVRKQFEEKLKKQQYELQQQRDELESFASTIAHDLRGKMQIISLYNSLYETEYSDKITESIEEMSNFIEDLLLLAKKGEILGEKSEVDLNELIESIVDRIQSLNTELVFEKDKLPKVYGDSIKLHQVFENILMNVVKHSLATKVKISYTEDENEYLINIEDNGKGISPERKQEILESWTTKRYTSFGLLIVVKIIQAHAGHILLESEEGKGTSLTINLPKK